MSVEPTALQASDELTKVSRRLLIVTAVMLALTVALFGITLAQLAGRFPISWFCFGMGVLGGFVSIQQRLRLLSDEELMQMAHSWVHILMPPLFGGIFALLLYLLLLSGIVEGAAFPSFAMAQFADPPSTDDLRRLFTTTYPTSGQDFAKLGVWTFAAGFSERLIPDMIRGFDRKAAP